MSSMNSPNGANKKGKAAVLCQASTSYKKKSGTLLLTKTQLVWNLQGSDKPEGEISFDAKRLNSLFMSKEGGAKVVLKVGVLDIVGGSNEESFNFTFTAGPSAVSDREHFKREISSIIAKNRAAATSSAEAQAAAAVASPGPNGSSSAPGTPFNGLPSPAQAASNAAAVLRQNGGDSARGSPAPQGEAPDPIADPTKDWQVRQRLLKKSPELLNLHIELVRTGQISEEEFWEGREYLLLAEAVAASQQAGRNAQIVDPKPEQTESGDIKIKLSQQLIKDIFEQYPIVAKVYNDNVPDPLAEAEFWHRYFHSKLFDRHRTTGRGSIAAGSSGNVKDDMIFDRYLEDEDDDLEPKNLPKTADVYRLLDLAATEEDHGETGNAKDFTMRAGSQRKSLPLMRRFNEHSERLLTQALGAQDSRAGGLGHVHGGDAGSRRYYDDIIITDLQGDEPDQMIPLDVQDRQNAYEGMATSTSDKENESVGLSGKKKRRLDEDEAAEVFEDNKRHMIGWEPDLGKFHFSRSNANQALHSLQSNIAHRLANSSSSSSSHTKAFPEQILRSMLSCQASANEFLRHFWSAVLPSNPADFGYSAASMATPAQKAGKSIRMIEYLGKTQERIDTIVEQAKGTPGADPVGVKEALEPCMEAVRKATGFYKARMGK